MGCAAYQRAAADVSPHTCHHPMMLVFLGCEAWGRMTPYNRMAWRHICFLAAAKESHRCAADAREIEVCPSFVDFRNPTESTACSVHVSDEISEVLRLSRTA